MSPATTFRTVHSAFTYSFILRRFLTRRSHPEWVFGALYLNRTDDLSLTRRSQFHYANRAIMAGDLGFEPRSAGIKIRCLRPTWRIPKIIIKTFVLQVL